MRATSRRAATGARPPERGQSLLVGLVGAVSALLLVGCTAPSGPLDRPEPTTPRPDLTLTSEFRLTATTVGWSWTLRNDDDEAVLVFVGPDPEQPRDNTIAPTWVLGANGAIVELAQRLMAPPEDVDFAAPFGVAAQVLEPGTELTGTAEARLPLATTLPWGAQVDPRRAVPRSQAEVYLCLGVGAAEAFEALPPASDRNAEATEGDAPYATHSAANVAEQHQFCTEPEPLR